MNTRTSDLQKAVRLLEKAACKNEKWRPAFHLSPPTGWLNDPNGLCEYKGSYHIFFQYSPFDTKPGLNYWGHYRTKDFISYEYLPPALCCDIREDCHGVYSGSAVENNGRLCLIYTGNVKQTGNYDYINSGREHNTICAFSDDGVSFDEKRVLMKNCDYPPDMSCHVRDPKVWREGNEWKMALGARTLDSHGRILIYTSPDLIRWEHTGTLASRENYGYMWECPDVFTIDGRRFVTFSPQGIEPAGELYNNVYQSGYCTVDKLDGSAVAEGFTELDRGFDFYAPQSFSDSRGRRIMIGWLGMPDIDGIYENPTHEYGWMHMLTLPCELYAKNGKLCRRPVEELKGLRLPPVFLRSEGSLSSEQAGGIFEAQITPDFPDKPFEAVIKRDMRLSFNGSMLTLSFGESGMGRTERSVKLNTLDSLVIFCDRSSAEIFVNGGEEVFTSRFYPHESDCRLNVTGACGITIYPLKGFDIA